MPPLSSTPRRLATKKFDFSFFPSQSFLSSPSLFLLDQERMASVRLYPTTHPVKKQAISVGNLLFFAAKKNLKILLCSFPGISLKIATKNLTVSFSGQVFLHIAYFPVTIARNMAIEFA